MQEALQDTGTEFVLQAEQRGTGHAVLQAASLLQPDATLIILNGDLPTLRPDTLRRLISRHKASEAALTLVTAELPDATGYGRVVRDSKGRVLRIVEHRDATPVERALREINCGIYCTTAAKLLPVLRKLKPDNAVGEYYLTDAVSALLARGEKVAAYVHDDAQEVLGVNTRAELARAARTLWARTTETLMNEGVTLLDPSRTWIDPRARVGRDTVIWPGVQIEGRSVIGEDCEIRSGVRLNDVALGRACASSTTAWWRRAALPTGPWWGPSPISATARWWRSGPRWGPSWRRRRPAWAGDPRRRTSPTSGMPRSARTATSGRARSPATTTGWTSTRP
jgi:bifunctional UDP-N-acetylglucosamine pyrophosphorylase/glucosamine-1-phosphate N-acetyltransferase